jgi:hypothetical protein
MSVEAPGRFSTTTGWLVRFWASSAMKRAIASIGLPGEYGTMMRNVRAGNSSADAAELTIAKANKPAEIKCWTPIGLPPFPLG